MFFFLLLLLLVVVVAAVVVVVSLCYGQTAIREVSQMKLWCLMSNR